jgi:Flp pilus assembly protein TadG
MIRRRKLLGDQAGGAAIEFAIAVPVLVVMIYGIFVIGMVLLANAGLNHALGEAARLATLYPTPSDTDIQARITQEKFGLGNGTLATPGIVTDNVNHYKTITLTYTQPTNFLFFPGPNVTITRSKRVYIAYD